MVDKVFVEGLAILSALHGWCVGVVVWSADSHTDLQKRISVAIDAVGNTHSILRKISERTHFHAEEGSRICIKIVRARGIAADIESVFVVGGTVQDTDLSNHLGIVVRGALSDADQVVGVSEVIRCRTGSQTLASWGMPIVFGWQDWTQKYTEASKS